MQPSHRDSDLLKEFAEDGSQQAFAALVGRHARLVYLTALRKAGDPGAAEEITQNVFCVLARKAHWLCGTTTLAPWLYKAAMIESQEWLRKSLSRQRREQMAVELGTIMTNQEQDPATLNPLLDEGLQKLSDSLRVPLLLHYFGDRTHRDIGQQLGVGEDAIRKRIQKGLDELNRFLKRNGYGIQPGSSAAMLIQASTRPVPVHVTQAVIKVVTKAGYNVGSSGLRSILGKVASLGTFQVGITSALLVACPITYERWRLNGVEADHRRLVEELARSQQRFGSSQQLLAALNQRLNDSRRLQNGTVSKETTHASTAGASSKDPTQIWDENSSTVTIPKSALSVVLNSIKDPDSVNKRPPSEDLNSGAEVSRPGIEHYAGLLGFTQDQIDQASHHISLAINEFSELSEAHVTFDDLPQVVLGHDTVATRIRTLPTLQTLGSPIRERLQSVLGNILGNAQRDLIWKRSDVISFPWVGNFGAYERRHVVSLKTDGTISYTKQWIDPAAKGPQSPSEFGSGIRLRKNGQLLYPESMESDARELIAKHNSTNSWLPTRSQ